MKMAGNTWVASVDWDAVTRLAQREQLPRRRQAAATSRRCGCHRRMTLDKREKKAQVQRIFTYHTNGGVIVGDVHIVKTDIAATKAILHVIDTVMLRGHGYGILR
jgi:Fasciclin domain